MYTWHGQGLALGASQDDALYVWPGFKSNVTIKKCRTVVVDLDMWQQLYSLVVWGTLRIRDRGPSSVVSLRAACISVKPGGRVLAGEVDRPYSGVLEFLLTGDLLTESHQCGGRVGMRIAVEKHAELRLYGTHPKGQLWGRLRQTAHAGSRRALLIGRLDFQAGDRLALATTGDGHEYATVTQVSYLPVGADGAYDTWLTFQEALLHTHVGVVEDHGGRALEMRGEVALYFRPHAMGTRPAMNMLDSVGVPIRRSSFIRIAATKVILNPNFRFRSFQQRTGLRLDTKENSITALHGVMMTDIGGFGSTGYSFYGVNCGGACDIRHSVFVPMLGDGIALGTNSYVQSGSQDDYYAESVGTNDHVENVVFHRFHKGVGVSGDSVLLHSAFIGGGVAFGIGGCGWSSVVLNNVVAQASVESGGYCMHRENLANITVHDSALGWGMKGSLDSDPTAQRGVWGHGVVMWSISDIGLWKFGAQETRSPLVEGWLVANAVIGIVWSDVACETCGPKRHALSRKEVTIRDSVFIGRRKLIGVGSSDCGKRTAVMMPISVTQSSLAPRICGDLGGTHRQGIWGAMRSTGSYPALLMESRLTGNTFLRYDDSCGESRVLEFMMEGVQDGADGVPPVFARGNTIDEPSRANLAGFKLPKQDWIVPAKCGVMDCDGPKQAFIHDLDGSLTGGAAGTSILARSEFMHEYRANGEFTWYNIPTKMLYDPCPLVRGPAPALRASPGAAPPALRAASFLGMLVQRSCPCPSLTHAARIGGDLRDVCCAWLQNNPSHPGWDTSTLQPLLDEAGGVFTYGRRLRQLGVEAANTTAPDGAIGAASSAARLTGVPSAPGQISPGVVAQTLDARMGTADGTAPADRRGLLEASEELLAWRDRMVFAERHGVDESQFFDPTATACEVTSALYDPACRTTRQTHTQVAYNGYGVYRGEGDVTCELNERWGSWVCPPSVMTPMRLIVENMDADHTTRVLVPVALASGGYVQLMNGGWDHESGCGGYECLRRLMTFWATVATNRSYDLTFTATNPQHLRLILPYGSGEAMSRQGHGGGRSHLESSRLLVSIFYSNPEKLLVHWGGRRVLPLEHHAKSANSYNFSLRKPTIDDP